METLPDACDSGHHIPALQGLGRLGACSSGSITRTFDCVRPVESWGTIEGSLALVGSKGACQITGQTPRWWVAVNPWLSVIVLVLCVACLAQAMKMR